MQLELAIFSQLIDVGDDGIEVIINISQVI